MTILVTLVLAVVLFIIAAAAPHVLQLKSPLWLPQVLTKLIMLVEALVLMLASRRPWPEFGFRRAEGRSGRAILGAFALGAAATVCILALGLEGLQKVMNGYTFPQIVLCVWIWSSLVEEIFVRGWVQSTIARQGASPRLQVLLSAALFGSMHLGLLRVGVEAGSVAAIVTSTFLLGLICATLRQRTNSLFPAIYAHIAFNVGGLFGGILTVIARKVLKV